MHHRLRAVAVTAGLGLALAALPAQGALADDLEATFPAQDAAVELSVEDVATPSDENVPDSDAGASEADVPQQSDEAPGGPAAETPAQNEAAASTTPIVPPKTDGDGDVAAETSPITEAETAVSNSLSASPALPVGPEAASEPAQQPTPVKGWSGNHYWDGTLNDDGTERLYTGWVVDDHDGEGLQRYWVIGGEKFTEGLFHVGDGTCGYALSDEGWVLRGISDVIEDALIERLSQALQKKNTVMVGVSEGVRTPDGTLVCERAAAPGVGTDEFGHLAMLSGAGRYLAALTKERIGCKTRAVELSTLQRCASYVASRTDLNEAYDVGYAAVEAAFAGETAKMCAIERVSNDPYASRTKLVDVAAVANQVRNIPSEWISADGMGIGSELRAYIRPLIGELPAQLASLD